MSDAVKHLADYESGTRYRATVVANERITSEELEAEVRELLLEVDRPGLDFEIGQSIGVIVPGNPEFGQEHHFRLYSVADLPDAGPSGLPRIHICVRRCSYVDEYSGEEYPGIASHYLCDLRPGSSFEITGPFGMPFEVPEDPEANLILIGSGTGIAPFRALVRRLYRDSPGRKGRVWLFHGARSGLEMLYMNERRDDFARYYDEDTFQAFKALSPRPHWEEPIAWDFALGARGPELWDMLGDARTVVYVAGLADTLHVLDEVFAGLAGSPEKWQRRKAELMAGRRWVELIY